MAISGKNLARARVRAKVTQSALARELGVSRSAVNQLERSIRIVRPGTEVKYRSALEKLAPGVNLSLQSSETKPLPSPEKTQDEAKQDFYDDGHGEVARSSLSNSGFAYDPQSISLASSGYAVREYERLRRLVPRLKMSIRILCDATFWVPSAIRPDSGNNYEAHPEFVNRDKVLTQLVSHQLKSFKHDYLPFDQALKSWFQYAVTCGFAVAEKVWESINGEWRLVALKVKQPWDFHPFVDEWGNLESLFHYPTGQYFHPGHFLFAPWPFLHGENYLGISEVEAIRHEIETSMINKASRNKYIHKAAIMPIMHFRSADSADADAQVDQMESMSMLHLPAKRDVNGELKPMHDIRGVTTQASQPLLAQMEKAIDEDSKEISRVIGIPDLLGVTDTSAGSWALGRTQFDAFTARPESAQSWISAHVQSQIIRDIVRYNYPGWANDPDYYLPQYKFEVIDEDYALKISQKVLSELGSGVITIDEARAELGWPPRESVAEQEV